VIYGSPLVHVKLLDLMPYIMTCYYLFYGMYLLALSRLEL
jgi:hypothetical protein